MKVLTRPPLRCVQVCGTDNKTYDSSCHFFATKCALEGTKKGHKLHLDYLGACKCEWGAQKTLLQKVLHPDVFEAQH